MTTLRVVSAKAVGTDRIIKAEATTADSLSLRVLIETSPLPQYDPQLRRFGGA
jgi:hypothetical protein